MALSKNNNALIFWTVLGLFIIPVSFVKIYGIDIWWHIQLGKALIENMGLPDFSRFYFTPINLNVSDLRYTWLGDIILYLIHNYSGDIGLQLFRVFCVAIACFILISISGSRYSGWNVFGLMGMVAGTFQKQLLRNSIFALILVCFLFWLWQLIKDKGHKQLIWIFPIILGVWGCLHGSYLLGFGVLTLILLGDVIDMIRAEFKLTGFKFGQFKIHLKQVGIYAVVIILCFVSISVKNPKTYKYYNFNRIKRMLFLSSNLLNEKEVMQKKYTAAGLFSGGAFSEIQTSLSAIKTRLNNTLFSAKGPRSGDFTSPFDKLNRVYVLVSLFMAIVGCIFILFFIRPFTFSCILPFAAICLLGLGYLRMVGYIPVLCLIVLFMAQKNGQITLKINDVWGKGCAVIVLILIYVDLGMGLPIPIGTGFHVFGAGRVPIYSDKCADRILKAHRDMPIFTTLATGSYLLNRWYPEKKVYIDGFFAPHPKEVIDDFIELLYDNKNPNYLFVKYQIEGAVIETTLKAPNNNFLNSADWHPLYLDAGMVFYIYQPEIKNGMVLPEILATEDEIKNLTGIFKYRFSYNLIRIPYALVRKGRVKDAKLFMDENRMLLQKFENANYKMILNDTRKLIRTTTETYGLINSKAIYYEFQHNDAIQNGALKKGEEFGLKVLAIKPDRYPILVNVALIYTKQKAVKKATDLLGTVFAAQQTDTQFWTENKNKIAQIYYNLFQIEVKNQNILNAYQLLKRGHAADPGTISKDHVIQIIQKLITYQRQNSANQNAEDLEKALKTDFMRNGSS